MYLYFIVSLNSVVSTLGRLCVQLVRVATSLLTFQKVPQHLSFCPIWVPGSNTTVQVQRTAWVGTGKTPLAVDSNLIMSREVLCRSAASTWKATIFASLLPTLVCFSSWCWGCCSVGVVCWRRYWANHFTGSVVCIFLHRCPVLPGYSRTVFDWGHIQSRKVVFVWLRQARAQICIENFVVNVLFFLVLLVLVSPEDREGDNWFIFNSCHCLLRNNSSKIMEIDLGENSQDFNIKHCMPTIPHPETIYLLLQQ